MPIKMPTPNEILTEAQGGSQPFTKTAIMITPEFMQWLVAHNQDHLVGQLKASFRQYKAENSPTARPHKNLSIDRLVEALNKNEARLAALRAEMAYRS